ncbi:MAG: hypothetical protein MRJ67_14810 [Nitrospirales bacterium]|nr:hypothetical protein [Nitrospirales bacterium]
MEQIPGTVERLIHNASFYLRPLFAALEDDGIQAFLELELNVNLPTGSFQGSALSEDIDRCTSALSALFSLAEELRVALEQRDLAAIASKAAATLEQIRKLAESIKQLRDSAQAISEFLSDPLASQLKDYCQQLFERIAMLLAMIYTDDYLIRLDTLQLIGLVDIEELTFGAPTFPKTVPQEKLYFAHIPRVIRSPIEHFESIYHWGENDFLADLFLERLSRWLSRNRIAATFEPGTAIARAAVTTDFFRIEHHQDGSVQGLSILHRIPIPDNFGFSFNLSELWNAQLKVTGGFKDDFQWLLSSPGEVSILAPNDVNAGIELQLIARPLPPNEALSLLSLTGVGHVDAAQVNCLFKFHYLAGASPGDSALDLEFRTSVTGGEFEFSLGGDGFLESFAQASSCRASFDLALLYGLAHGLQIEGSGGADIRLPVHFRVGPVELHAITISVPLTNDRIPIDIGASLRGNLGPLTLSVDRIGMRAALSFPEVDGNLGPLNLDIGFRPPAGIDLSVDGGGFKGGGFLRFEPEFGRYAGILELEYQDQFTLKAFGLLESRLPNGQPGFSLVIVINAEFNPIQLGLGFTLNGVGGLLGLHRTANVDRLVSGLHDQTLANLLFPTDIVANADRILSDLRQVFPPAQGRFIFGPMAKIGWGTPTLLTADIGLLLEVPEPVRLLMLGVVRGILPDERTPILRLQVNFLGVIDFEKEHFSFDASLFDSKLLSFPLSGDMAMRLYWGADANFLTTVGGFHPAYQPPPMNLPTLRRLTLALLSGDNPRLTLETYFALTSNTAQFGARLELYAAAWKFNVYGFLSFDALFQFNPFYFIAEVTAMLALRTGTSSIASIKLTLSLEGPTPWKAKGDARLKLCWFLTVKVRFNKTFGERRNTTLPDLAVLPLLTQALKARDNWVEEKPAQQHRLESLRELPAGVSQPVRVHPVGTVAIGQKVVPLNIAIDRIGAQRPADARTFAIAEVTVNGKAQEAPPVTEESFAPAQFFDLSDAAKLASPSFKTFASGIRVGNAQRLRTGYAAAREVKYEVKYIDSARDQRLGRPPLSGLFEVDVPAFNAWARKGATAKSALSFDRRRKSARAPEKVGVAQESFAIVHIGDLRPFDEDSISVTEIAALKRRDALIAQNPALRGSLQVVPLFELSA